MPVPWRAPIDHAKSGLQAIAGDEDAAMQDLNERERRDIEEENQVNGAPDSSDDEADSVDEHLQVSLSH